MNIFDIVGPIMVGPSSSHTAGAVRIGRTAGEALGERPKHADIFFHGSFAETFKGHGSDKAVIGGLLGFMPDDSRIKYSLEKAAEEGLTFTFNKMELIEAHPNTIVVKAVGESGRKISLQGASVGGGNIVVQKLNGLAVEFNGNYDTLLIEHWDTPGTISTATNYLASKDINIANMKVFRSKKGGRSLMIIEVDGNLSEELVLSMDSFDNFIETKYVKKL